MPSYARYSVADHLDFAAWLSPGFDRSLAERRIAELAISSRHKAGKLSGGQRAQLALTLALAKRPELLVLDEPVASLDPLARFDFLQDLKDAASSLATSVVLSSHLVADLERICDYIVLLVDSRVRLASSVEDLLGRHRCITFAEGESIDLPDGVDLVGEQSDALTSSLVVERLGEEWPVGFAGSPVGLEDVVLAHMRRAAGQNRRRAIGVF